jgi:hypothetical protein
MMTMRVQALKANALRTGLEGDNVLLSCDAKQTHRNEDGDSTFLRNVNIH